MSYSSTTTCFTFLGRSPFTFAKDRAPTSSLFQSPLQHKRIPDRKSYREQCSSEMVNVVLWETTSFARMSDYSPLRVRPKSMQKGTLGACPLSSLMTVAAGVRLPISWHILKPDPHFSYSNIPVRTASHVAEPGSARTWSNADRIPPIPLIFDFAFPGKGYMPTV